MHETVIKNAAVITGDGVLDVEVALANGKIAELGHGLQAKTVLDARGLYLFPGGIDTQVHFREPGLTHKEDLETGTRSAILGGITTIFEMPNTQPTTTTAEALADKLARSEGRAWCDYAFFVGASTDNIGQLATLEALPGTPGVKIFMGSSTGTLLVGTDDDLRRVLQNGRKRCPIHAEDEPRNRARKSLLESPPHPRQHPFLRDAESARLATERILALSAETGRPVHILHLSTRDELPLIAEAKAKGLGTTAEVTPQHLWFTAPDCYDRLGSLVQMNPPIRSREHNEGLWQALGEGLFDVFGSDHAPHTLEEKAQVYPASPSGMPGVQTMFPALLTFAAQRRLGYTTIARMLCERPATLYGIEGKGRIAPGFDADLTLVDPLAVYTWEGRLNATRSAWSPYEGEQFCGRVEHVFLRGRHVVREGDLLGTPGGACVRFQ